MVDKKGICVSKEGGKILRWEHSVPAQLIFLQDDDNDLGFTLMLPEDFDKKYYIIKKQEDNVLYGIRLN